MQIQNLLLYLSLHKNNIPKVSHNNIFIFEIHAREICGMFIYKHSEKIE